MLPTVAVLLTQQILAVTTQRTTVASLLRQPDPAVTYPLWVHAVLLCIMNEAQRTA